MARTHGSPVISTKYPRAPLPLFGQFSQRGVSPPQGRHSQLGISRQRSLSPAPSLSHRSIFRRLLAWRFTWFLVGLLVTTAVQFPLSGFPDIRSLRSDARTIGTEMEEDLRPKFVLFGDSLTQQSFGEGGWGATLQDRYSRQADVVVRGYGGYNTRWALFLLDQIFPKGSSRRPPALVTIFFGANDAALDSLNSSRQHVPIPEYKANLQKMIEHIRSVSSSTRIILMTPPPVDEEGRLAYARATFGEKAVKVSERQNAVTQQYAQACLAVAQASQVDAVDLWRAVQQEPMWTSLLRDGLHFTPQGQQVVFQHLFSVISAKSASEWVPPLDPEKMPLDFPHHGDIDTAHPEAALSRFLKNGAGVFDQ
eukprot:TRINITY_DN18942_c0_g1_i2.p1 TRINITY_DN18942_c0_g1~~TRINITY_DN18942_c0_g1_i2.p1  ORF type:complete len:366 (-),score=39.01 TRINITY_DN18942_c0_g1_i2:1045-2142(-)